MSSRRQWVILGVLTAVYLVGLGVLAGVASERFRFDSVRSTLVRQLDEATARARGRAMSWEREVDGLAAPSTEVASRPPAWLEHVHAMDREVARREFRAADVEWRHARSAAIRSRTWRPLIEVGDAALRMGTAAEDRRAFSGRARELYMAALTRARADGSVDGVLRVGQAFRGLGDGPIAEQCLIIAEGLRARRPGDVATTPHGADSSTSVLQP